MVVAKVAQMEAEANANPQDAQKQIALFEALVATGVKPGYDVVIARWERMCEFVSCLNARNFLRSMTPLKDPTNPLIRSDIAFQLYLNALLKNGLASSVDAAVRRRDSILAATASASASSQSDAVSPDATSQATTFTATATATESSVQISQVAPTSSQKLAQAVLAGQGAASSLSASQNTDMAKLQAALGGGLGGPASPIVVTLAEREY